VLLYFTQSRWIVQVFSRTQENIRVITKRPKRRIASDTQHPANIVGVVAVVYGKLVLFELKGLLTDSTIIPLKFQEQRIICGGKTETVKAIYVRFARTAQKVSLVAVYYKIVFGKLTKTHGAGWHDSTPAG